MLDCLIIGDSIAVGTKMFKPQCVAYAQSGINSEDWNSKFGSKNLESQIVVISLGSNDLRKFNTRDHLVSIRQKITAAKVMWIEPNAKRKPMAAKHVRSVAQEFGDLVLTNTHWQPDQIHPNRIGYQSLAERIK